jgi:hypothetical protein
MAKFQYWQSEKDNKWYFHLKASNGRIILGSQGYASKQNCIDGFTSVTNTVVEGYNNRVEIDDPNA